MKLTDLNPKFGKERDERTRLIFDCPKCKGHRIAVPIAGKEPPIWQSENLEDFSKTTLSPSIDHDAPSWNCRSHFFIRNGEIIFA